MMTDADEMLVMCVPPEEVYKIWKGAVHDMVDSGFAAFDVPMPDDILQQLKYGTRLLWIAVDASSHIHAALLTQLFEMRSGKVCKVLECGGHKMKTWVHLRTKIEDYAKAEGCGRVIVEGRAGWARMLPDYRMIGVTLEKAI